MGQNPLIVIEICLGILTIVILILSGFLISMVIQISKSVRGVERVMKDIGDEINPLISKMKEAVENIHQISEEISHGVTTTANAVRAVENTVKNIAQASSFLSAKNFAKKILVSGIWVGVKAGFEVLKKRLFSKKK